MVRKCISEDQIPLIYRYENTKGKMKVNAIKGSFASDYTAISHVWAGGLGNSDRNALLLC